MIADTSPKFGNPGGSGGVELPSAADIRRSILEKQMERAREELRHQEAADQEKRHREEMFLAKHLTPEIVDRLNTRIRTAAEEGQEEMLLGQFPSSWLTDGGRKVNMPDETWPDTLQGFGKEVYEFFESELKPKGFHLRAEILNFPGGMPGDVGFFLSWKEAGK